MRYLRSLFLLFCLGAVVFAAACDFGGDDDDDSGDDDASDDDADDDSDDDSGDDDTDDDTDDDSDDDSGDDDSGTEDLWGVVYLSEGMSSSTLTPLTYSNYAGAAFYDPDDLADWNDPVEEDGDCVRYFYDYPNPIDYDYLNGGAVTVTGANVSPIHLTPSTYEYGWMYTPDYDFANTSNLFDAGDALSVQTAGHGEIPAFAGSVDAPAMIEVTQPGSFDSLTGVPQTAYTVRWNAKTAVRVTVAISTTKNYKTQSIVCTVDDADGEVTVPASLMADLYTSPTSLTVSVTRTQIERITQSGKDLEFQAQTYRQRSVF